MGTKATRKSTSAEPMTAKRKREERLRRNRESANRSRIRKKKEMLELKQNLVLLRQKVATLSNRIEELEENNQGLRERLAMYKKPSSSYKPAVTVFALVFTVAFFSQPSAAPQVGLTQLAGQGSSKVMSSFGRGSKGLFLAPIVDLLPNGAIDTVLSASVLPTMIAVVTKILIALVLASMCAMCFHYFGNLWGGRQRRQRKSHHHISDPRNAILESV